MLNKKQTGLKRLIIAFIAFVFFVIAWKYYSSGQFNPDAIQQYQNHNPIKALFLFVLFYVISVIALLPSLPLNLAAGFFWGGLEGGIYSTFAVTLASWISFAVARLFFGKNLSDKYENKWVKLVQDEFEQNEWKFLAFARLNPIIPTGILNYLLSLTTISNRSFLWITFLFILPPSVAVAYIGDALQTFTVKSTGVNEILHNFLIISAAITFLVVLKLVANIYRKGEHRS